MASTSPAPVHALHLGYGQPRQQRRRRRQGVEGGQVLAVRDETLEDAPGQVVGVVHARRVDRLGSVPQSPQNRGCVARVQLLQDVLGNGEDGPVVDLQDVVPGRQHLALGVGRAVAAHRRQGLDLLMHPGDVLVEDQGVGDDGAGHPPRLRHVDHSQNAGYRRSDAWPQLLHFVQELRGPFDTLLQRGGGLVYGALRDGHHADHVGQVLDGALQPAGLRESSHTPGFLREDAVGQAGCREGGMKVVGAAHVVWVAEGYGGLDGPPVGGHLQPQAGLRLRLDGTRGHVLRLDHDGGTARRGDDDVGAQPWTAGDGLRVLGPHLTPGQHALKQAAHSVVGVRLGLARHTAQSACVQPSLCLYWIDEVMDIAASAWSKVLTKITFWQLLVRVTRP